MGSNSKRRLRFSVETPELAVEMMSLISEGWLIENQINVSIRVKPVLA